MRSIVTMRIMASVVGAATPEGERLPLARAFCYRLVFSWWRALTVTAPGFPLRPLLQRLDTECLPEPAAATDAAGFSRSQVAFVTAYEDREAAGFHKTAPALAWGSFAWFRSEPSQIIIMRNGAASEVKLNELVTEYDKNR